MPLNFNGIPHNASCYNIAQQHSDLVHDISSNQNFIPEKLLTQQYTTEDPPPDGVEKVAIDHSSPGFVVCIAQKLNSEYNIVTCPVKTTNSALHINVSEINTKRKQI